MEKYLFQNRKTRHKSARIRIQSSPANIRDCSNRVASPQNYVGQWLEHQIIDDSLNNYLLLNETAHLC